MTFKIGRGVPSSKQGRLLRDINIALGPYPASVALGGAAFLRAGKRIAHGSLRHIFEQIAFENGIETRLTKRYHR